VEVSGDRGSFIVRQKRLLSAFVEKMNAKGDRKTPSVFMPTRSQNHENTLGKRKQKEQAGISTAQCSNNRKYGSQEQATNSLFHSLKEFPYIKQGL
jgi:hypothetical protein